MSWRKSQARVENALHEFLGLDDEERVIYMNRAASAIEAVLSFFDPELTEVWADGPTFHAVPNIMERLGFRQAPNDIPADLKIPVALGGEAVIKSYFAESQLLYDCAQTCYQNMFEGIQFGPGHYAVLSFQESKPYGSPAGGGALVCNKSHEERIRELFVPGTHYFNPRTGQCEETLNRLRHKIHAEIAEGYMKKYCYEEAFIENSYNIRACNTRKSFTPPNLFTHVYVLTPRDNKKVEVLLNRGYTYYSDNKLMRKELA